MPMYIGYPKDRLNYMLENSNTKILITNSKAKKLFSFEKTIILDDYTSIDNLDNFSINKNITPQDLAYIIYTSGSTGLPKGVQITNRNLLNFVYSFKNYYKTVNDKDSFLASTNISFDVSIWEIFLPLLSGSKLVLYNEEIITNIVNYCNSIIDNNITALYIPPNILEEVFELLKDSNKVKINKMLVGVEPIKKSTLNKYFSLNPNICIINGYGPTETTICATALNYKLDTTNQENYISIGKPLNNNKIFILNKFLKHQPIGIPGEIYISGDGVGKGYINRETENEKNFVIIDNTRFYKTGDLAKWNEDGTISFIGREDFQVKVNGYRIELKEIDSIIMSFPRINKSHTITIKKGETHQLVSYFTSDEPISINDLKSYLQSKLAFYMIPSYLMQVDDFPLTANGKLDIKSLPKPKLTKKQEYIAPRNETEETIASILTSLLQLEKISIDDNFFDIGGDSLIAIKFQIEALKKNLDISYNDIFSYPTIRLLSEKESHIINYEVEKNYNYDKINILINKNKSDIPKKVFKFNNTKLLLFGSTGFLGAHILDEYLSYKPDNIVYCVIRKKSLVSSEERLRKLLNFYFDDKYDSEFGKRIFVIEGDITKENLGISDYEVSELFNNVEVVVNSAAIVKHHGDSDLFNATNVVGTKNISNLCKEFKKKLYHISTLSVSGMGIGSENTKISEKDRIIYDECSFYIGQNLNNIYLYTKFEAEKIILEGILSGLDATILRIGNLTNRYSDGKFQINLSENAFTNKVKSILNLGVVQNNFLNHATEFTPVDYCAKAIISILNTKHNYSILHLFNVNVIDFSLLLKYINDLGYKIEPVTNEVFAQTVTKFLNDNELKNKISGIATDLTKNKILNYFTKTLQNADITNKFLNKIGFSWPILDFEYFKKYFDYYKNISFF